MLQRWTLACLVAVALTASGCSGGKTTSITPSAKPSSLVSAASKTDQTEASEEPTLEPQKPVGSDGCVDVTSANLDLAVATDGEAAQTAADLFEKYDPPASVKEAIDHFVETGGVQFDDPEYAKFNDRIDAWVKAVCPS